MMWGYGWFVMTFMWIGIVLGIVAIIAALVAFAWWLARASAPPQGRDHATVLDSRARRYARGEMDEATFERMRGQMQSVSDHAVDHAVEGPAERERAEV